ncbi:MAG: nicotinate (nicotinamide) nucleotide adenylyltransferase [Silvibacterium sp.]|nr:nicotinate (nicotinamide) nucleotide adenylyltransferase [Silvibacterium sp.]MBV8436938.1 nicotinate (nicotinamide) nucleotide adenylyltransferase [Silvibacterium sp.]
MRIALFGGSFDPPHRGHVALARLAIDCLHLDRVLVAPVGLQPLKHDAAITSFEDRIAMATLAFAGDPRIEISRLDAPLPDHRPNYTIETVFRFKRTLAPNDEIFCLLGADSWLTIGSWYRATELLMACGFIVGARPGFDLFHADGVFPEGVSAVEQPSAYPGARLLSLRDSGGHQSPLYLLTDLAEDVSATAVRDALSGRLTTDPDAVLDAGVANYIHEHNLYSVDP